MEFMRILEVSDGVVPFRMVDDLHQQLGRLQGKISTSPARGVADQDTAPLAEWAAILEEAIVTSSYSGKVPARVPARDLVDRWLARKEMTTLRHDLFDRRAVRQVFANAEMDGPAGARIFDELFTPESSRYLRSLVDVVYGDDEAMNGLRKAALYRYKNAVSNSRGEVDLDKHNQFMQKFSEHIRTLFPNDTAPFAKIGVFEQRVVQAEARAKALDKIHRDEWYNIFGRKYKYTPDTLVRDLAGGGKSMAKSQVSDMVTHLEKTDPALLDLVRKEARTQLRLRLGATKAPSAERIEKYLGSVQAANYRRLMGAQGETHLRNLKTVSEALQIAGRRGESQGTPATNALVQTSRAVLGPLHRAQRFITASRTMYQWMNAKDAYAVLADPERLRRALQYAATSPALKSVPTAIAADIGALSALFYEQEKL
jgi:hypothetical protein